MGTVAVNTAPGTAAATLTLNELPAVAEIGPLDATPAELVVTTALKAPLPNAAPLVPACGKRKVTVMPGTGILFESVNFTTACELTRPFLGRLEVLAPSMIVNLYFCGVPLA
jgi:hypothetical protein